MAMVRAFLKGPRPSSSSPPFLRGLRLSSSEATALTIPAPGESSHDIAEEHSVKAEADSQFESGLSKLSANIWRMFLNEQAHSLNELQYQLKDQRALLNLIWEEITLFKSELKTRKDLVGNAVSASSKTNPEAILEPANELCDEKNAVQVSCTGSTLCDRNSENKGPVLSEKSSKNGASLTKKQFNIEKFQHPPWPEWALFLDHLRPYALMKEWKPNEEARTGEIFDDTALLKHALVKFAQTHEAALRTLSREDLLMIVQHEFPSMDEKTAAGKRRLQNYLEMDGSRVAEAKLTDVVRLIYRAVRSVPSLGGALPSELKSAIVHILEDLNSASSVKPDGITSHLDKTPFVSSEITEGTDQKNQLAKMDETETSGDMINMVDEEAVLPVKSPSINQNESTLKTSAASTLWESPKFSSLKERVDARRARLARENLEKETAEALEPPLLLTKELDLKTIKKSTQMDKSKDDRVVVRNFKAFDSIIESDDSDFGMASKSQPKPVSRAALSSSVQRKVKPSNFQNKGIQTYNGQKQKMVSRKHQGEDCSLASSLIHDKEDADENGSAVGCEGGQDDVGDLEDEEWSDGSDAESDDETRSEGEVGDKDGAYVRGRGGRLYYNRDSIVGKNGRNHG